jgi:nucleotide-binding universal stress UspA family protein
MRAMLGAVYQVIVVGTDGSETAGVALRQAVTLAKLSGATLHVVHAHQPLSASRASMGASAGLQTVDVVGINDGLAADSSQICDRAASMAAREGVSVETHSRPSDAATALIDVAEEVGADLLVIGNRGMSGARRFILGSVPNKVSHHCPCSLLIVDTGGG